MNIRTLLPAALVVFALLLTACEISVSPGGPQEPDAETVRSAQSLGSGETPTASSLLVPANGSVIVEVTLGSAALNDEAIYFEVDGGGDAELYLYSFGGAIPASSSSPDVFLRGTAALTSAGATAAIDPQIVTVRNCIGPCIIDAADQSRFYIEVFNMSSFDRTFDLYVYTQAYGDVYDPSNGSTSTAVGLGGAASATDEGAVEFIGDEDYWAIQETGELFFNVVASADPSLDLRLRLIDDDGFTVGTYQPGPNAINVLAGDIAIVFENGDNAAAVSGSSRYFLEIQ